MSNDARLTAEQVERYRAELHKLFNHHSGVDALCDMALRSLAQPAGGPVADVRIMNQGGTGEFVSVQFRQGQQAIDGMTLYSAPPQPAPTEAAAEYARQNPLGGVANVFRAMADRIEAGEPYADVLEDYGYQHAPTHADSPEPQPAPQGEWVSVPRGPTECRECPAADCSDCPRKPARWVPQS